MILHPGILALLVGSVLVFTMMLYATFVAMRVAQKWDFESSSELQLTLERKTYLVSTVVHYALGFEIVSILLFIYTVDDLHVFFSGAMCATGSLNANPVGWYALLVRLIVVGAAAFWIVLNHLDQKAPDYPLVRTKYTALFVITPLVGVSHYLQAAYFLGLEPEIITSCCGALFSESGSGLAAGLTGLPVRPMMGVFYGTVTLFLAAAFWAPRPVGLPKYVLSGLSILLGPVALASIISFISLYVYESPTHHCPFDMFQSRYYFVAYPLYASVFGGVFFGALPGLFQPLKRIASLTDEIGRMERKWIFRSVILVAVFLILSSWPILFGSFTMRGYM